MSEHESWMIAVIERYTKVAETIVALSSAAIILPVLLLRDLLGVQEGPVWPLLDWKAVCSGCCFGTSVLFALLWFYLSGKWVKQAYHQKTLIPRRQLGWLLETAGNLMAFGFLVGLVFFIWFAAGALQRGM